jgi:glycosyltransferase involved in cell wall biosynthesis
LPKHRLLIIHPFLWTHYKATIFSELQKLFDADPNSELLVLQIALNEKNRTKIGIIDWDLHKYNFQLLFNDYSENTTLWQRFKKTIIWIRKFKPTVINLPGYYDPAMNLVFFYCKLVGIKVILSIDSTEGDNIQKSWKEIIKKWIVRNSSGFFCYGTKSAELMLKLGAKSNQILLRNNAVDNNSIEKIHQKALKNREIEKQKLGLRKYNFIYVGRLIEIKNIDKLFEAYKIVQNKDWGLTCLGEGDKLNELKQFKEENQLDGIQFVQGQKWQDVPKFLALADVFVLPSYSEPWGLVVNEAMVCQMPVLVSNRCGCAVDLVHEGKNGFTFDPILIDEIASKMSIFVENPNFKNEFGKYSKELIKTYSPQNVSKEMFDGFLNIG